MFQKISLEGSIMICSLQIGCSPLDHIRVMNKGTTYTLSSFPSAI
jgi:hypothetical protein